MCKEHITVGRYVEIQIILGTFYVADVKTYPQAYFWHKTKQQHQFTSHQIMVTQIYGKIPWMN